MTVSFDQQMASVRRELAMRKNVYPKWVASKRMKQEAADKEIAAMQAVHDTLTALILPADQPVNARLLRIAQELCSCHLTDGFCGPRAVPDCKCWTLARLAVNGVLQTSNPALKEAWPDVPEANARKRLHALVLAIVEPKAPEAKL